jgi:hypothetical protein
MKPKACARKLQGPISSYCPKHMPEEAVNSDAMRSKMVNAKFCGKNPEEKGEAM